jgi:hypothetical protein
MLGVPSRSSSRASSRVRGVAGDVGDDVWIIPSVNGRPGSSGSGRSMRMRTSSPVDGSWRSTRSVRSRPRGRDVFDTMEVQEVDEPMVDDRPPPQLLPPPTESRRKRPGYFSAREEDLDDMEVEDVTPARKKQRILSHSGPKFAALWEPSRRENWPLGVGDDTKWEGGKGGSGDIEPAIKHELQGLESPAFRLPPSARKESNVMDVEQSSPSKTSVAAQTDDAPEFQFHFSKPPASTFAEASFKPVTVEDVPETKESPSKTASFMQSILSEKSEEDMEDIPTVEKATEEKLKENGVKEGESQASVPKFEFSMPSSQNSQFAPSTQSSFAAESSSKESSNGGFNFGKTDEKAQKTGGFQFGKTEADKPAAEKPASSPFVFKADTHTEKPATAAPVEPPTFTFGAKPAEPKKTDDEGAEKKVEKPASTFTFGKSAMDYKDSPTIPSLNSTGLFGFGAPPKSDEKPMFPTPSSITTETPATNGTSKHEPAAAPVAAAPALTLPTFAASTSGFTFGTRAPAITAESPRKVPTPTTPTAPDSIDDSMDITDSPPATRNTSLTDLPSTVPQFDSFKFASAPTSAPSDAPKAPTFQFGQSSAAPTSAPSEAPQAPGFQFGQSNGAKQPLAFNFGKTEEKKSEFGAAPTAGFGTTSNGVFGASTSTSGGLGGFGSAFAKKDEPPKPAEPAAPAFGFQFNAPTPNFGATPSKPVESNPGFGAQSTAPVFGQPAAPAFGGATNSGFGNTPFPSQAVTSPPIASSQPGFNFNFNAPAPVTNTSTFGGGSFAFGAPTANIPNPFASNPPPAATSPAPFTGAISAPVSPQNHQTFPSAQPFGAANQQSPFSAQPTSFQFGQTLPAPPMFTLGSSQMQRSSSDNVSPSGRRMAQPGRRRFNNRR